MDGVDSGTKEFNVGGGCSHLYMAFLQLSMAIYFDPLLANKIDPPGLV